MASCITPTFGNSTSPQVKLTVTQSSATETTATLSWTLEYVAHGYAVSTSVSKSYAVEIAGEEVKTGTFNINGITGTQTIASGTKTINKLRAQQTVQFGCSMAFNLTWNGTYAGTKTASGTITVAAKTSYTVSYNANGGTGTPTSQTKWHGTNITLSNLKPVRTGYTFKGWGTSSSGSVVYQSGATYSANASVTLYAIWQIVTYSVTYNANGGSGAPAAQTKTYGQSLTLSSTVPTRTNHSFVGWGTSASSTTAAYDPGGSYTKNASVVLYAVWKSNYTAPRIENLAADRCNGTQVITEEGESALISFDWACDKTVTSIVISWAENGSATAAGSYNVTATGTSGSVLQVVGSDAIVLEKTYIFTVTVTDSGGSTTQTMAVYPPSFAIDILAEGKGIAFGCPATVEGAAEFAYDLMVRNSDASKKVQFQLPTGTGAMDKNSLNMRMFADGAWGGYGRLLSSLNTRILLWTGTWEGGGITVPDADKFTVYILYPSADLTEMMIGIRSLGTSTDIQCFGMRVADNTLTLHSAHLRLNGTTMTRIMPRTWTLTGTSISSANQVMKIYRIEGLL